MPRIGTCGMGIATARTTVRRSVADDDPSRRVRIAWPQWDALAGPGMHWLVRTQIYNSDLISKAAPEKYACHPTHFLRVTLAKRKQTSVSCVMVLRVVSSKRMPLTCAAVPPTAHTARGERSGLSIRAVRAAETSPTLQAVGSHNRILPLTAWMPNSLDA